MAVKSVFRRFFRILLIVIGVHAIVIVGLHIWFVNNARGVLTQIVSEKSNGKLNLRLSRLSFDFISNKLQIREADLESTDTVTQAATYHVKFRKLTLRINSFWPLILQKRLLLDSIKLHDPVIDVMLWRQDTTSRREKDDLSVPQEMGKLYNSMLDALDGFGIRRIVINNASLSLVNKMKPESKPVNITQVYLDVIRTPNHVKKRDDFVKDEHSVDLRTAHQNIALPGGRHQLSFKTFTLQLFRKYIELDSCTITAIPTERSKSSYQIFFSKLLLIGVDFTAMYRDNLIRADSVYCENPLFDINLIAANDSGKKKERPDPEKIIRELTGDLDLAFVGVKDAGIKININGSKTRSLFNSNKDNFEMRGLRVNSDSSQPVQVQQFDMLVRDYRLYNEDSSTVYSFDSVTFKNNKIVLNNFSVTTESSRYAQRSLRDYKIPYFELTGLDWYELVFDETLRAREAVLYNPVINYTRNAAAVRRRKKTTNFFTSLQSIDNLVTLDKINIIHGQINMKMGPATSFNFKDVNLSLYSDKLLKSTNKEGLRKAVDQFSFSKGLLKLKDITAELHNIQYTGKNLIHAEKVSVRSASNKITASADDVYIDNMLMDDEAEKIVVDGLRWKNASLKLVSQGGGSKKNNRALDLQLKNVSGNNTEFSFSNDKTQVTTFVNSLIIDSVSKTSDKPVWLGGYRVTGKDISINSGPMQIRSGAYLLSSQLPGLIIDLAIQKFVERDSLSIQSSRVDFSADLNEVLSGDIHVSNLEAKTLKVNVQKWGKKEAVADQAKPKPTIRVNRFMAREPDIFISSYRNDSVSIITVPGGQNSMVTASGVQLNNEGFQASEIKVNAKTANYINKRGEAVGVEQGSVDVEISDLKLAQKDGKPFWSGLINNFSLKNPKSIQLGNTKNKLLLNQLALGNLHLSSDYLTDFNKLIKFNVSAWLRSATGQYIDSTTTLNWYNAGYDNAKKTLSLDSFSYYPTQERDSVILNTPHQVDYLSFHSGRIEFTDFNLEKYKSDTSLIASAINISNPQINIYRDKKPPFLSGIIKPLPVGLIRRITLPVSVARVNIIDGKLSYIEKNAKSRAEATIFLNHMNGGLSNLKNRDYVENDSLGLALTAYFMDSAYIDLKVKESYNDTLSGFLMSLQMKPTTLSFLNPVLAPLSNVIITSGTVDSLQLRAIGREHLALGEMRMFYRDLKIKLVKPGAPDETTFTTKLATFIANTFIIKKNNKGRIGLVYFERLRDRSFFNYIVKMTLSGMATSVGFKKNKKYRRQYERELQDRNLPPINF